jgi:hypothetical protein
MADLHAVVARHMETRGMSVRALARAVHHDPSYLSKALRGLKPLGPALARNIDQALGAGGEIIAAAAQPLSAPVNTEVRTPPELAGVPGSGQDRDGCPVPGTAGNDENAVRP